MVLKILGQSYNEFGRVQLGLFLTKIPMDLLMRKQNKILLETFSFNSRNKHGIQSTFVLNCFETHQIWYSTDRVVQVLSRSLSFVWVLHAQARAGQCSLPCDLIPFPIKTAWHLSFLVPVLPARTN